MPPVLGYTGDKGPLPPKAGARQQLFDAVSAGQAVVFDLELVAVADDLLDRGDYDDLSMEEVADLAKAKADAEAEGDSAQFGRGVV